MGRAIDLFVTYRFIKLLVTPFEKTDAFKLGIIDEDLGIQIYFMRILAYFTALPSAGGPPPRALCGRPPRPL